MAESDLYPPIKAFLEGQGYDVKAEINGCDVVAKRGDEPPVIVELKARFNLEVVLQAIDRLALSDAVYVAFADGPRTTWRTRRRAVLKLCRMLGLGVLLVRASGRVTAELDPAPYRPRKSAPRQGRLLLEHARRVGDPNEGGTTGRPQVTAYRQDVLRLVHALRATGESSTRELRESTGVATAATMLQRDVYGWFERARRGVYRLSPKGEAAAEDFAEVIQSLVDDEGES
jgi:hypothetical protein